LEKLILAILNRLDGISLNPLALAFKKGSVRNVILKLNNVCYLYWYEKIDDKSMILQDIAPDDQNIIPLVTISILDDILIISCSRETSEGFSIKGPYNLYFIKSRSFHLSRVHLV
jgi:hypothetical protein